MAIEVQEFDLDLRASAISYAKHDMAREERYRNKSWGPGRSAKISTQYANRMIVFAAENGNVLEAHGRMESMRRDGLKPDGASFNALLSALISSKDIGRAEEWLASLSTPALYPELTGIGVTAGVYNALVVAHAEQNRLASAEQHARDMEDKGLRLDKMSYESLLRACLSTGQSRRAHQWCLEMIAAGFKKPNVSLMRSLICALTDAGNTQSANHWLAFMAEAGHPMDQQTYELVRTVHPLEIVPAALSGEVGRAEPPVVRPACLAGERRLTSADGATQAEQRFIPLAGVASARRRTPVLMLAGSSRLQAPVTTTTTSSRLQAPLKNGGIAALCL
jgi:pentatricopeptide repeat protein